MYVFNKISVWENASKEKCLFSKDFSRKISIGRYRNKTYKHFINLIKTAVILLAVLLVVSCGGGGGGGVVSFQNGPQIHNGGDSGGFGTGNQTGNGFNPQGQSIEEAAAGLLISQMAALSDITGVTIELTINGIPYPAINADETTTTAVLPKIKAGDKISGKATIYVMDGEPRVAFLDETEATLHGVLKFKVPYNYECYDYTNTLVASGTYYSRDGINLSSQTTSPITGWECAEDGSKHYGGYLGGLRGDIRLNALYGSPDCNIDVTPANGAIQVAAGIYKITDLSQSFGFTLSGYSSLPSTASLSWQVNGAPASGAAPDTCSASPNDALITDTSIGTNTGNASNIVVSCTISGLPGQPAVTVNKTIKVFKLVTLTGFDFNVDYNIYTGTAYPVYNTATPVNFSVFTAAGLPLGTVYNWTITNAVDGTVVTRHGAGLDSIDVTPAEMGSIGNSESTATSLAVSCTISHPDNAIPGNTVTETLSPEFKVYKVTIPNITVTLSTPPTGLSTDLNGAYLITAADLTSKNFGFTANPSSGILPSGVKFAWSIASTSFSTTPSQTDQNITKTLSQLGVTSVPAPEQTLNVVCTVSHDNLPASSSKSNYVTVKIVPKPVIPACTLKLTSAPAKKTYASSGARGYPGNPGDNHSYQFKVERSDDPSLSFPTGTTFEWVIKSGDTSGSWVIGGTSTYGPNANTSLTLFTSNFGSGESAVTYGVNGPRTRCIWCTIKMPGADDVVKTYSLDFIKGY